MAENLRAGRNRTITLSPQEKLFYATSLRRLSTSTHINTLKNSTVNQDIFNVLPLLTGPCIDVLFIDPPYNLTKSFNGRVFNQRDSTGFARRAMADLAFEDHEGFYYVVDVKTHRLNDTKFNMPNLTSVERLARFYEDNKNYFVLLLISYEILGTQAVVRWARFVPIEFLDWNCLTLGALGWGQIQLANSNVVTVRSGYSRKLWMIELCDRLLDFYPKEISKIGLRIDHFNKVKTFWENQPDE